MTELTIQDVLETIRRAENTISAGRQKARQAKALLGQVEAIEKEIGEAQGRVAALEEELGRIQARADREIATARDALAKARNLRPVLGEEFVARAKAAVAQIEQEWATRIQALKTRLEIAREEVRALEARLEAARKELRTLAEAPEVQAYLAFDEHKRQEEARHRALREAELRRRLQTLRLGALIGEGEHALRRLAAEAEAEGFTTLAAEASEAAERAVRVRLAREAAEEERAQRRFIRWCQRRAKAGQPVLMLSFRERKAVALEAAATRRGRIVFTVAAATGFEGDAPKGFSQLPARARFWRVKGWKAEAVPPEVGTLLRKAVRRGLRGREFNEMNAALARARDQEAAAVAVAETAPEPVTRATAGSAAGPAAGDLDGLSPTVARRLQRVGLNTREAVQEAAADETALLALPGIGPATLAAVREWLGEPATGTAARVEAGEADEPSSQVEVGPADPAPEAAKTGEESEDTSPNVVESEVVVVGLQMGADMPGIRLNEWRGIAHTLVPVLGELEIPRLELLVEESWNGNGPEVGLLATWDGNAVEVVIPGDGNRSCRIAAMRRMVQELRATAAA